MPMYSVAKGDHLKVKRVFLDGVEVKYVTECDTDDGWLRACDPHPKHGNPYQIDGHVAKVERHGVVTVEMVT